MNGVYFLANDRVYSQVISFLNSFRAFNPELPLCLIPFDGNTERLQQLSTSYRFSVFDRHDVLMHADEISHKFHGRLHGHYRKLAAWHGPYEQFIYIDIDTVVLHSFAFVFPLLRDHELIVAHSDDPHSVKFVWKVSPPPGSGLSPAQIAYSANTGFIASHRGLLAWPALDQYAQDSLPLARYMELLCYEQPFLNYCFVRATNRFTSIRKLNKGISPLLPCEAWAGDSGWQVDVKGHSSYKGQTIPVLFVHWSGEMVPLRWEKRLFRFLSLFGVRAPGIRLFIRQRKLWRHFRHLHEPPA